MMEFTFEASAWESALSVLKKGDVLSAVRCLALLEDMSEDEAEEALLELEERGITLDVSDLPKDSGSTEAAVRLRQEQQWAEKGLLLQKNG